MMRDSSDPNRVTWFCFTCTLPSVARHRQRLAGHRHDRQAGGKTRTVPAFESAGRWVTDYSLRKGEQAFVAAGGVVDAWGNFNGAASATGSDTSITEALRYP